MNHSKISQVVVLMADVVSFLEYINLFSSTEYVATDVVNVFLFFPYQKERSDAIFT